MASGSTSIDITAEDRTQTAFGSVIKSLGKITKTSNKTSKSVSGLGAKFIALNQSLDLATKAGEALISPFTSMVDEGKEFSSQMSSVAAISKLTSEEFTLLSEKAKEVGAKTAFSATEAAVGLEELKRAGQSTKDSITTLEPVMNLVSATGAEMGAVAKLTATQLGIFQGQGLTATEAVDVMNKTLGSSAQDFGDLNEALIKVSPLAGALNIPFVDLNATIGLLADQGIKGADAGTALKIALQRLTDPPADAKKALDKFGLSVKDISPESNNLKDIFEKLRAKGVDTAGMFKILGSVAGPKFIGIVGKGAKGFDDFAKKTKTANTALKSANVKLDNLTGDTAVFSSTMSAIKLTAFEALEPVMRGIIKAGTEMGTKVNEAIQSNITGVKAFLTALTDIMGVIHGVFTRFVTNNIKSFETIFENLKAIFERISTAITTFFEDNKEDIDTFAGAFVTLFEKASAVFDKLSVFLIPAFGLLLEAAIAVGTLGVNAIGLLFTAIDIVLTAVTGVKDGVGFIKDRLVALGKYIEETALTFLQNLTNALDAIMGAFSDEDDDMAFFEETLEDIAGFASDACGWFVTLGKKIKALIAESGPVKLMDKAIIIAKGFWNDLKGAFVAVGNYLQDTIKGKIDTGKRAFKSMEAGLLAVKGWFGGILTKATDLSSFFTETLPGLVRAGIAKINEFLSIFNIFEESEEEVNDKAAEDARNDDEKARRGFFDKDTDSLRVIPGSEIDQMNRLINIQEMQLEVLKQLKLEPTIIVDSDGFSSQIDDKIAQLKVNTNESLQRSRQTPIFS